MTKRYLEDIQVGEGWTSAPFLISESEIIAFGRDFDPQPFHTDPDAAKNSPFGGLIASGWHLTSLAMKVCVAARSFGDTPVIGLGADELRWFMPVRPGDQLVVEREVVEILTLPDKPKRGTVRTRIDLKNQRGELVMRLFGLGSVPRRPAS